MQKMKGGILFPLVFCLSLVMVGMGAHYIYKKDDSALEEKSEQMLEDELECMMGLPDDALDGTIDLTPSSPEK